MAKWCPGVTRLSRSYNHDQRIESAGEGVAKWWPGVTRSSRSYNQYGESRRKPRASARGGCQQRIESARKGVTQVSCARDDSVTAGHHLSHTLPNRFARSLRSLAHPSHAPRESACGDLARRAPPHRTAPHRIACITPHHTALHRIVFAERSSPRAVVRRVSSGPDYREPTRDPTTAAVSGRHETCSATSVEEIIPT